jgi:hypothetical protein
MWSIHTYTWILRREDNVPRILFCAKMQAYLFSLIYLDCSILQLQRSTIRPLVLKLLMDVNFANNNKYSKFAFPDMPCRSRLRWETYSLRSCDTKAWFNVWTHFCWYCICLWSKVCNGTPKISSSCYIKNKISRWLIFSCWGVALKQQQIDVWSCNYKVWFKENMLIILHLSIPGSLQSR